MHRHTNAATRATRALALGLGLFAAALAAAQPQPTPFELETWRAAASINTPAAYNAYLAQFPSGAFAAMAKAALEKLGVQSPATLPATLPATSPATSSAALGEMPGEIETSTTALALGDKLSGPGVITVGGLGSRRQLVLPRGEWLLLAGYDHASSDRTPVSMATLVFGRFEGTQLRSLLISSFNRRSVAHASGSPTNNVVGGSLPAWPAVARCEATEQALLREVSSARHTKVCAAAKPLRPGDDSPVTWPAVRERLVPALQAIGGKMVGFNLSSEVQMSDVRHNYLGYVRLDCVGATAATGPCPEAAAGSPTLAARVQWLKAFAPMALDGLGRHIESDDLKPGKPTRRDSAFDTLPD
jgi:hypothetical protein